MFFITNLPEHLYDVIQGYLEKQQLKEKIKVDFLDL